MDHIDVRLILKTDDGVNIYLQYLGVLDRTSGSDRFALGLGGSFRYPGRSIL